MLKGSLADKVVPKQELGNQESIALPDTTDYAPD
jgi:hypothetical protein